MKKVRKIVKNVKLPNILSGGQLRVTIYGDTSVCLENYKKMIDVSESVVVFSTCRILGGNLKITYLSQKIVLIDGDISSVVFNKYNIDDVKRSEINEVYSTI